MLHPSAFAQTTPDKIAYRMAQSGATLTFRELEEAANRGAHVFRALGLQAGDHIAFMLENSLRFLEICWSAQRSGLYFTAISTHLTQGEIAYIIKDCGARVFIASSAVIDQAPPAAALLQDGVQLFMSNGTHEGFQSWEAAVAQQPTTPIADQMGGFDMLYSSGTTGRPKGVKSSLPLEPLGDYYPRLHPLIRDMCRFDAQSVYLSPAPLYHAAPLRYNMMAVALGGTSIVMEKFDPETFLQLVETYRVTNTQLVPTMFVRMLKLPPETRAKYDVTSLTSAVHAAAPCAIDVKRQMIDWWGPVLLEYYAGTEANGGTFANSHEWLDHPGTVGRAIIGELRIVGDDDAELPVGETGAVYFANGPQFAYHNDPAKTQGAYNAKGWSTLGDVGYVDEDGYLYLTDRKAYMIISGGVNIYPQEAENILITHPAVMDVAVFGIPNDEMGEEVKAVVQLAEGIAPSTELAGELIAFCRQSLAALKCPKTVDFEQELPRTPTGKLLKRLLRDRYVAKRAAA
jgi:long-chain acyl-CoA synthetase